MDNLMGGGVNSTSILGHWVIGTLQWSLINSSFKI